MSLYKKKLGKTGEDTAEEYLIKRGYKIIKRNYRCRFGEIDIISYKDNKYIFVEVKTRKTTKFGRPSEAINYAKKNHLRNTAQYFIQTNRLTNCDFRFDVIEIIKEPNFEINHLENIMI